LTPNLPVIPTDARRVNPLARWFVFALAVFSLACSTAPDKRLLQYLNTQGFGSRYTGNAEEENYVTLRDSFTYRCEYNPELRDTVTVGIDGTVVLPAVGAVPVAGMSRTELEALLTQRFAPFYERTDIRIVQLQTAQKVYFVYGEVGAQGPRPFPGDLTVFEAVMAAGPNKTNANLGRVRLIRADPRDPLIIQFNMRDMLKYGDSTFNVRVQERDIIVVPPTLLAQIGNFFAALVSPFTQVFQQVFVGLIQLNNLDRNLNNNNFGIF
jgi:protein involved in polysaccharide export with SLBB domain